MADPRPSDVKPTTNISGGAVALTKGRMAMIERVVTAIGRDNVDAITHRWVDSGGVLEIDTVLLKTGKRWLIRSGTHTSGGKLTYRIWVCRGDCAIDGFHRAPCRTTVANPERRREPATTSADRCVACGSPSAVLDMDMCAPCIFGEADSLEGGE